MKDEICWMISCRVDDERKRNPHSQSESSEESNSFSVLHLTQVSVVILLLLTALSFPCRRRFLLSIFEEESEEKIHSGGPYILKSSVSV